jgi:hypothetical protein
MRSMVSCDPIHTACYVTTVQSEHESHDVTSLQAEALALCDGFQYPLLRLLPAAVFREQHNVKAGVGCGE